MTDRRTVVAFTGTMTDAPGRQVPRFPDRPEVVAAVAAGVRAALARLGALEGISSAARGSDLLFLEALLGLGGVATVLLPFPAASFVATSVGHGWDERFRAVLGDPRVQVRVLAPAVPADVDLPAAFEACNAEVRRVAVERAAQLGCEVRLLAVWNGHPGDGRGGTADFVRAWEGTGARAEIVPLPTPAPPDRGRDEG